MLDVNSGLSCLRTLGLDSLRMLVEKGWQKKARTDMKDIANRIWQLIR